LGYDDGIDYMTEKRFIMGLIQSGYRLSHRFCQNTTCLTRQAAVQVSLRVKDLTAI
jgi:hypothetical protein